MCLFLNTAPFVFTLAHCYFQYQFLSLYSAIMSTIDFTFKVRRCEPELIAPANRTLYEFKQLSDMDDQESFRFHIPILNFYEHNPSLEGRDPVKVIKEAISKTLVFYYPLAGRLREGPGRKLFVECTGEGILFIEAEADVTLEQFGDALQFSSSFSWFEDVIYNVLNSDGIVNSPLLLIQVYIVFFFSIVVTKRCD